MVQFSGSTINQDVVAHTNLGVALAHKDCRDEAIAELREAIRLKKDNAVAHYNLGVLLAKNSQLDEAILEYRAVLRIENDHLKARCNLGSALGIKGRLDEAEAEYREVLRLKEDVAEAHSGLGNLLENNGQFAEALKHLRRCHELGSKNPRWPYPSAQWVRNCERLVELDGKLPAILSGQERPAGPAESLALAQLCQLPCRKRYADAVRFYREVFAEQPKRTGELNTPHRYNAACAAVLAGCGQGEDVDKFDAKERARLRQQALDWLRADLKAYRQVFEKSAGKAGPAIAQQMQHWLQDTDFAGVRGDEALAKLPAEDRSAWRKLWVDVAELLAKAQKKDSAEKKPNTKEPPRDHTDA